MQGHAGQDSVGRCLDPVSEGKTPRLKKPKPGEAQKKGKEGRIQMIHEEDKGDATGAQLGLLEEKMRPITQRTNLEPLTHRHSDSLSGS